MKRNVCSRLVLLLLTTALLGSCCFSAMAEENDAGRYSEAVALLADGKYQEAGAIFEELYDYEDSKSLLLLCSSDYPVETLTWSKEKHNVKIYDLAVSDDSCVWVTVLSTDYVEQMEKKGAKYSAPIVVQIVSEASKKISFTDGAIDTRYGLIYFKFPTSELPKQIILYSSKDSKNKIVYDVSDYTIFPDGDE